jgi:uncharacterized protein (UPF0548 family)
MFLLARPSTEQVRQFLASARLQALSYPEAGMTQGSAPAGYHRDHNRIVLGGGAAVFAAAVAAMRRW